MGKRIEFKEFSEGNMMDSWLCGEDFFIQAALFEKTGYADWKIEHLGKGPRDNRTDGEIDNFYFAWRVCSYTVNQDEKGELEDKIYNTAEMVPKFRVNGNSYSYISTYKQILESIPPFKTIDLTQENCKDERAIPTILKEKYLKDY